MPADPDRGPIGAFVRERRRANDLTQRQLAELAGVGVRFVSELERDKPTLRMDAVNAVLAVFGRQLGLVDLSREVEPAPGVRCRRRMSCWMVNSWGRFPKRTKGTPSSTCRSGWRTAYLEGGR